MLARGSLRKCEVLVSIFPWTTTLRPPLRIQCLLAEKHFCVGTVRRNKAGLGAQTRSRRRVARWTFMTTRWCTCDGERWCSPVERPLGRFYSCQRQPSLKRTRNLMTTSESPFCWWCLLPSVHFYVSICLNSSIFATVSSFGVNSSGKKHYSKHFESNPMC